MYDIEQLKKILGMTKPLPAPSTADLVNPIINQAATPTATSRYAPPYGRAGAAGNLTSQFVPPGEGATPGQGESDIMLAILSLLKNRGLRPGAGR